MRRPQSVGANRFAESVQAASYMQNFSSLLAPRKTEHGYIMAYPAPVEGKIGLIECARHTRTH